MQFEYGLKLNRWWTLLNKIKKQKIDAKHLVCNGSLLCQAELQTGCRVGILGPTYVVFDKAWFVLLKVWFLVWN